LQELLLTAICAVLSGADSWAAVALWGRAKLGWLRQFLPFANGVASHDTFGRVFALLDAAVFEECFIRWMRSVCGAFEGLRVAIDGKTARRSGSSGGKAIHLISAYAHGLGQVRRSEKSNDITAMPELLDALLLKGCMVTIDAMGSQKAIAAKIVAQECDYALGLRTTRRRWRRRSRASSTRRCVVTDGLGCLGDGHGWPGAKALVMVESIRETGGVAGTERRYYISSRLDGAERMGPVVRGHWGVEDGLRGSLDVAFGEGQARMREGHAPGSALGSCRLARRGGGLGIPSELQGECRGGERNLPDRLAASGMAKLPRPFPTINRGFCLFGRKESTYKGLFPRPRPAGRVRCMHRKARGSMSGG